jgi:hypothetical protein
VGESTEGHARQILASLCDHRGGRKKKGASRLVQLRQCSAFVGFDFDFALPCSSDYFRSLDSSMDARAMGRHV